MVILLVHYKMGNLHYLGQNANWLYKRQMAGQTVFQTRKDKIIKLNSEIINNYGDRRVRILLV